VIYRQQAGFVINSGKVTMDNVKIYDVTGRLLAEKKHVDASETTFTVGGANQVLIVKITSDDNKSVTKQIIN
jgi:hypothetical protein